MISVQKWISYSLGKSRMEAGGQRLIRVSSNLGSPLATTECERFITGWPSCLKKSKKNTTEIDELSLTDS